MLYTLIIVAIFTGPGKTGIAVDHVPNFTDQAACEAAATTIKKDGGSPPTFSARTYCVATK